MQYLRPLSLLPLILALTVASASAQSPSSQPEAITSLYACQNIPNDAERLSCYDRALLGLQKAQTSGEIVTVSKTEVEKVQRDAFGFNIPSLPSLGKLFGGKSDKTAEPHMLEKSDEDRLELNEFKSLPLEIERTKTFGYGKIRFYFKNGQVWEQTDSTKLRIPKIKNKENQPPQIAIIKKGSLGGYILQMNGKGRSARVKRIK